MSQKIRKDDRGEQSPGAETFKCCGPLCDNAGPAEEMFNVSCDPANTSREEILAKKVRCRQCAEKISSERGKRLREPGCGVYPLARTLQKMTDRDSVSAKRLDTIRWVEAKIAEREAKRREEDRKQRAEESKLIRDDVVRRYASRYVDMPFDPHAPLLPVVRCNEQGDLLCGLPVGCCRHDHPADRFITVFGEVVGICRTAASIFTQIFKESDGRDQRLRRLLSTGDLESAKFYAARWCGEETDDGDDKQRR